MGGDVEALRHSGLTPKRDMPDEVRGHVRNQPGIRALIDQYRPRNSPPETARWVPWVPPHLAACILGSPVCCISTVTAMLPSSANVILSRSS
jgi:hypothetical protein